jgi:hypothetical protein
MKHLHHIVPKHMGGSDDHCNLIELTVAEHAEAHRILWEKHGKKEDKIAWLSLSAKIGKEELFLEKSSIGGINNMGKPKSEDHKSKISESLKQWHEENDNGETNKKISESMIGNSNAKNHSSEDYKKKQSEAMKVAWSKRKAKKESLPQ